MEEQTEYFKVCSFIFECCIKLELSSVTLATAAVNFHKFFNECRLEDYDAYTIASACILLATKVEEDHVRLRDVINVCHRTLHSNSYLDLNSEYWDFKEAITKSELQLLRMLKFQVTFDHPHKYMLHYLLSLSHLFNEKDWKKYPIANIAWGLLRDSYHGKICLNYSPQVIALGCITLALSLSGLKIPFKHDKSWWKICYKNCSVTLLTDVQVNIIECYNPEKK